MTAVDAAPVPASHADVAGLIAPARSAQTSWEQSPVGERLRPIAALRRSIASDPLDWARRIDPPQDRSVTESLAAEVGPLADACQWLQRHATRTLKARTAGGWFGSLALRIERKPLGVVLVIAPSNYPLFLLATPAVQALAAGNAVLLKPAPAARGLATQLLQALVTGGLDPRLCTVLDDTAAAAQSAIDAGIDHIVLTGSAATGRAVARQAAERLTPCTLECSGHDAVIVLPGADLERVVDCVAWGLTFNSGATCIGPRRMIVVGADASALAIRIEQRMPVYSTGRPLPPVEVADDDDSHDAFSPRLVVRSAASVDTAIDSANDSPYALGAAVFGPQGEAAHVASRLRAGCVTVNDLIAPTADPRVPFGGVGESGYGVTRGAEGLLAMTRPQAIIRRRGRWLPHLDEPTPALDELLAGMIQARHGTGLAARWRGVRRLTTAAKAHKNHK